MSTDEKTLTSKQRELLNFIESSVSQEQRFPSFREMAKALGVSAVGTIQDHIKALIEKGRLLKEEGILKLAAQSPFKAVPILGDVAAGPLTEAIENSMGTLNVNLFDLPKSSQKTNAKLFALRVKGQSMIDAGILENDYLIIDSAVKSKDGDFAIVMHEGSATCKEIRFLKNGHVKLIPHNSRMKAFDVPLDENCRILGKVVALQRFY